MSVRPSANQKGAQRTLFGVMAKSGQRWCERCKSYQPINGTVAKKPWVCTSCKPRMVNK